MSVRWNPASATVLLMLVLMPEVAEANAGIGFFMVALPLVILALIPAILIEAGMLRLLLPISVGRSLALSLRANGWSTLVGTVLAGGWDLLLIMMLGTSGLEATRWTASIMLLPFLWLSWWVELRVLTRQLASLPVPHLSRVIGVANLVSYGLIAIFVWSTNWLPKHETLRPRVHISHAVSSTAELKRSVEKYYREHRRWPVGMADLSGPLPDCKGCDWMLSPDSRIVLRMVAPDWSEINQRVVVLSPQVVSVGEDIEIHWGCGSTEISSNMLPGACRN